MQAPIVEDIITALDQEQQALAKAWDKQAMLGRLEDDWQAFVVASAELEWQGLADLLVFYTELLNDFIADKDTLTDAEWTFLLQSMDILKTFLLTGSPEAIGQLLSLLQHPHWPNPVAAEDIHYLQDLLEADRLIFAAPHAVGSETVDVMDTTDDDGLFADDDDSFCPIDNNLLREGMVSVDAGLAAMIAGQCALLQEQWQAPTDMPEVLGQTVEALQPIIRAVATVRLSGCELALSGLVKNLQCYQDDPDLLTEETPPLLVQAFAALSGYLHHIGDPDACQLLVDVFENPEWPYCLASEQSAFLLKLCGLAQLAKATPVIAETVDGQDLSLDIPADIDAQLLDMVFNDLPRLTEEFAKSLHQFLHSQDFEALRTAQRGAHTVKGLANMIGVKGLANLTHRLEDLLDYIYQHGQMPDRALSVALIDGADCLALMCEALLAHEPAPSMSLAVLQQLADGHFRLKTGVVLDDVPSLATQVAAVSATAADTGNREEAFVRVPKPLLDNLFRIAGEVKVYDAQLEEHFKQIKNLLRTGGERHRRVQKVLTDLENLLDTSLYAAAESSTPDRFEDRFDHLEMNRLNEMHSSISRLYEAITDSREIERSVETYVRQMHNTAINLAHLHKDSLDNILDTRLLAVESMIPRLQRTLRQACRVADKQAELAVLGADTLIDSQILNQLADPLMHIIRNAVDHGLETSEQRLQGGKPAVGRITLNFVEETDMIVMTCEDDGRGINREAIKNIALSKGLIDKETEFTDQDIDRMILIPGFSTSTTVSQLSGRGIGMDVVYQEVVHLKGKLDIASVPGQGCRFTLSIPSSSLLLKATLAKVGGYTLSIIQYGIDNIFLSPDGKLNIIADEVWFAYQDQQYKAYSIESLVGVPTPDYTRITDFHLLLVNLGQEKVVVMVSELLDNRELVFKDMGRYVPHNAAIPGVTILPDGHLSPVLDLPEALKDKSLYNQRVMDFVAQTVVKKLPKILVVDDSLSARKSLATLLKDSGYEIATAIDGQDALSQIEAGQPDLVITDMEMPRMNGVELTAAIKQQRRTAKIPVLMITSRSTDKHRMEASIVGVDAYLTKPWSETELLQQIEALL